MRCAPWSTTNNDNDNDNNNDNDNDNNNNNDNSCGERAVVWLNEPKTIHFNSFVNVS